MHQTASPNADIPFPRPEQFAELLERLARDVTAMEDEDQSSNTSNAASQSSRMAVGLNPITPITARRKGANATDLDIRTLSYEEALRSHARYRPVDESLRVPINPPASSHVDSQPQKQKKTVSVPSLPSRKTSSQLKGGSAKTKPLRAGSSKQATGSKSTQSTKPSRRSNLQSPEREVPPSRTRTAASPLPRTYPLLGSNVPQNNEDHRASNRRSTALSVRVSEEESVRLRMRALECGISVSAYMRSCVLEVDHLRTQVKLALEEIRSQTLQAAPAAAVSRPQPILTGEKTSGARWFLLRFAAFFLGEKFLLRRNS